MPSLPRWTAAAVLMLAAQPAQASELAGAHVLVMSETAGYRHASIPAGQAALLEIAREHGLTLTFTEDSALINDGDLDHFDAVVFLNTSGDILDPAQQASFERYIKGGRGLLGIHAATDTETGGGWPWYNALIGASFKSHPQIQEAQLSLAEAAKRAFEASPSLRGTGKFGFTDEWYDFADVSPTLQALILIDRGSYDGSTESGLKPIVWRNEFAGGRSFYIGLGHTDETYASPIMRDLIVHGLRDALGSKAP